MKKITLLILLTLAFAGCSFGKKNAIELKDKVDSKQLDLQIMQILAKNAFPIASKTDDINCTYNSVQEKDSGNQVDLYLKSVCTDNTHAKDKKTGKIIVTSVSVPAHLSFYHFREFYRFEKYEAPQDNSFTADVNKIFPPEYRKEVIYK